MNLSERLTHIQEQVSADSLTNSCSAERCTVHLDDIPKQKVVIDVEKEFDVRKDKRKRCDRMLFYGNDSKKTFVAVPIELKGRGKGEESQVLEQLKNGLEFAAALVKGLKNTVYVPIVFTKSGIRWTNPRHQNKGLAVNFQGKSVPVLIGRCGGNLAKLLSEAGYL